MYCQWENGKSSIGIGSRELVTIHESKRVRERNSGNDSSSLAFREPRTVNVTRNLSIGKINTVLKSKIRVTESWICINPGREIKYFKRLWVHEKGNRRSRVK